MCAQNCQWTVRACGEVNDCITETDDSLSAAWGWDPMACAWRRVSVSVARDAGRAPPCPSRRVSSVWLWARAELRPASPRGARCGGCGLRARCAVWRARRAARAQQDGRAAAEGEPGCD
eukprot:7391720-Prymnesium_polylepis.1